MKLQPQIDTLRERLDAELDNFPAGTRFFSLQEIMKKYRVNLRVVNGALEQLEAEKLICRERYRGIFSRVDRRPNTHSILLVMPDFPGNELVSFGKLIRNYQTGNPEFRFLQLLVPLGQHISPPLERADALLLMGDANPYSVKDLMRFEEWGKPVVFFCRMFEDFPFSSVNFNNIEGGMLACEHLISHGCRNLLAIRSECPKNDIEERLNAFQVYAEIKGIPCTRLNCVTVAEESANTHAFAALTEYLKQHGGHFDGVFIDCYGSAPGVFAALKDYGLRIPADVSAIAFHGFGEDNFCRPPLTTVGCEAKDVPHLFFEQLKRVFNQETPCFHLQLPMHVMERGSVRS